MTLDELIEKLQAARTLYGGELKAMAASEFSYDRSKSQEIDMVDPSRTVVWLKHWTC
jgi:hypothetical protein